HPLQYVANLRRVETENRRHTAARQLRRLLHRLAALADDAQRLFKLEGAGNDEAAEFGERMACGDDGPEIVTDGDVQRQVGGENGRLTKLGLAQGLFRPIRLERE